MTDTEPIALGRADDIDESFVPRPRDGVSYVELDDEMVIASPVVEVALRSHAPAFDAHWLDGTATVIWKSFDGTVTLGALIDELSDAFSADHDLVRDDVLALARTLGRAGLFDGIAGVPPPVPRTGRPEGLPVGTPVPPFAGTDLRGATVTSDELRGRHLFLVHWSPTCGYCERITGDLAALVPELQAAGIDLVLLADGDAARNAALIEQHGLDARVLLGDDGEVFHGLGTPCAYLVDAEGAIASELAVGANEVPALARAALDRG